MPCVDDGHVKIHDASCCKKTISVVGGVAVKMKSHKYASDTYSDTYVVVVQACSRLEVLK